MYVYIRVYIPYRQAGAGTLRFPSYDNHPKTIHILQLLWRDGRAQGNFILNWLLWPRVRTNRILLL